MTNWQFNEGSITLDWQALSASEALALYDFVLVHYERVSLMAVLDAEEQGRQVCSVGGCMNVCEHAQICDYCNHPVCEHHRLVTSAYDSALGITSYSYSCPDARCRGEETTVQHVSEQFQQQLDRLLSFE